LTSEELANVPFLILGNKIDLGRAASEEDLRYQLGLFETYGKETKERDPNVRPIELYMCSVVRKMGYGDGKFIFTLFPSSSFFLPFFSTTGFKWLAQFL
jgi:GTP-binding protein SAR1